MKKLVFIKESTALIVLVIFLVFTPILLKLQDYYASSVQNKYTLLTTKVSSKIDSLKTIQYNIYHYDSINQTNQKLEDYELQIGFSKTTNKNFSSENLSPQIILLNLRQDSLVDSLKETLRQIQLIENRFDSISPEYSFKYRNLILYEKDKLLKMRILAMNKEIESHKQNIKFVKFISHIIYGVPFILYPLRWVLLLLFRQNNLFNNRNTNS